MLLPVIWVVSPVSHLVSLRCGSASAARGCGSICVHKHQVLRPPAALCVDGRAARGGRWGEVVVTQNVCNLFNSFDLIPPHPRFLSPSFIFPYPSFSCLSLTPLSFLPSFLPLGAGHWDANTVQDAFLETHTGGGGQNV